MLFLSSYCGAKVRTVLFLSSYLWCTSGYEVDDIYTGLGCSLSLSLLLLLFVGGRVWIVSGVREPNHSAWGASAPVRLFPVFGARVFIWGASYDWPVAAYKQFYLGMEAKAKTGAVCSDIGAHFFFSSMVSYTSTPTRKMLLSTF